MMNVKYVITHQRIVSDDYSEVFRDLPAEQGPVRFVYERKSALPRAYLVPSAQSPPPGLTMADALCTVKPKESCVSEDLQMNGSATFQAVAVNRHSPNSFSLDVSSDGDGIVVISQTWHPDWRATDNGRVVPIYRVNHAQSAVVLQAGIHRIRLHYIPWDFYCGSVISIVSTIIFFAARQSKVLSGCRHEIAKSS